MDTSNTLVLRNADATAAASTEKYLQSNLVFKEDKNGQHVCLVKAGDQEVGVMMGWEKDISLLSFFFWFSYG